MAVNQNQSQNKNNQNRRRFNRKRGQNRNNNSSVPGNNSQNGNKPKSREYKFHMHDDAQRKTSESFNKIKEAIVLKIQKTFDEPREVAGSIKKNIKKVFAEPELAELTTEGTEEEKRRKDDRMLRKWQVEYTIHQECKNKFEDNWVKAYSLIWDSYCSKEMQIVIKELPDF